ncbi:MAG: GumC family protein, partial [Candidatus Odinarchaeota archaeon]
MRWLLARNSSKKETNPSTRSNPSSIYAGIIRAKLEVVPVRDTKLVRISYSSNVPRLCAEIVNAYATEFMDFESGLKYTRTEKFSNDLAQQIGELRSRLEDARRQRQKYATDRDLILSDSESAANLDYQRISNSYTQAYSQRLGLGAILSQVRDSDIDSLASIDYPRILLLQREYLDAKNNYAEMSRRYRENHPARIKANERLERAQQNLEQQASAYVDSDYQLALQEESRLKRQLESKESEIIKIQSDIGVYRTLDVKVQSLDAQLINLEKIKNELDTAKGLESLKTSNISLVDEAGVPGSPVSPNKAKNFLLALLFGLFSGVGMCFLLEYFDSTIKGPEEVEKITGLPSLGVIPFLEQEDLKG